MRRLPPLGALKAVEAAARRGSLTSAAEELRVSHSAVSQQVKALEAYFGRPLFHRSGRGVVPTPEAATFLEDVRASLDRIAIASEHLARGTRGGVIRINATPSFAVRWLIPQTSSFQIANPAIEIKVTTSTTDEIDQRGEPQDLFIRRAPMQRSDYLCRRILDDVATPVVAPSLLARRPIAEPGDLARITLLHLKSRPDAWRRWFQASGVALPERLEGPYFEHFFLSLQAASNGLGAALGPYALIGDDLALGRLVAPLPRQTIVGPGFHALYRENLARAQPGRTFLTWLFAAADRQSGREPS